MGQATTEPHGDRQAWNAFWHGGSSDSALPDGHPGNELIEQFWARQFGGPALQADACTVLDLACGGGFVARRAWYYVDRSATDLELICLDVAVAALVRLREQLPDARMLLADAAHPPLRAGSVDVVASQFGAEYAGPDAFGRAARLVAQGGQVAMLVHHAQSPVCRECADNEAAAAGVIDSGLLPAMKTLFTLLGTRSASRADFETAQRRLEAPVKALARVIRDYQPRPGGALARRLYDDAAHLCARPTSFAPSEVIAWIDGMASETTAYRDRMLSMQRAALDRTGFDRVGRALTEAGIGLTRAEPLRVDDEPLAWIIEGRRAR